MKFVPPLDNTMSCSFSFKNHNFELVPRRPDSWCHYANLLYFGTSGNATVCTNKTLKRGRQ